jgi:hypothetical protein
MIKEGYKWFAYKIEVKIHEGARNYLNPIFEFTFLLSQRASGRLVFQYFSDRFCKHSAFVRVTGLGDVLRIGKKHIKNRYGDALYL